MAIQYSFVIPVFRSVSTLGPLYDAIAELMRELGCTFEVIYVEDGGPEESWRKLLEIKQSHAEQVTIVRLTRNFGQNGATLCGIAEARGAYVVTLDDDLQVHPNEIKKLIACQQAGGYDMVYGMYAQKEVSWLRRSGAALVKRMFSTSEGGSNIGSSIRLITAGIAAHLRNHSQDHLFINQVISWYTFNTGFVEVTRKPRPEGKSGYTLLQLARITLRLVFLYTSIPLKVMIAVCIFSSLASLVLAGHYIYQHFVLGHGLGFLVLIVIAISLILASISVMGIYLNRIYNARIKKPHYAVKIKL